MPLQLKLHEQRCFKFAIYKNRVCTEPGKITKDQIRLKNRVGKNAKYL